jgi:yecA family protein
MTIAFDHDCGLLSPEDQEKMKSILKRLDATRGAPGLHGMLTASVVGPKPVPLDWILQAVLSHPESEPIALDHLPEFCWLVEKIEELFLRINLVFQQDPEMFRPLVYMRNLKEGGTAPDPRGWCFGFAEAMMYHRKAWEPLLSMEAGFLTVAPILMTADPDGWGENGVWNPFNQMAPTVLCEGLKMAARAIHAFWPFYAKLRSPIRASVATNRNDPCSCGSGRKYKRCCGSPLNEAVHPRR